MQVYEMDLAGQVAANINALDRVVAKATDMQADQLATDLVKAQGSAAHAGS